MLDQDILNQLKEVFAPLENEIIIEVSKSKHTDQKELLDLLNSVASTSSKFRVTEGQTTSVMPQFKLLKMGRPSGISFSGIPTGHEFTTLIVALLNVDGKGKLPDSALARRISSLKGPVRLKTYISLTCENCPDVVQALNQMALIHPDFQHEMIDGAYVQDEIKALGIQGVPSLVVNSKMIHSGKISLLDLVAKLEAVFGIDEKAKDRLPEDLGVFDVAVIGGGPAGSSSAIYSARKGLKTALIAEKMGGQLQETKGIENMISVPYTEGPELSANLMKHLKMYSVNLLEHRRVRNVEKVANSKSQRIIFEDGDFLETAQLIIATGAKWRELNIPGEKEYLGRGVAFCPHCDGPFYKGRKVAVIGGGNSGVEAAIDLSGIVSEVVLFEFNSELKADQVLVNKLKSLKNAKIIVNAQTQEVLGDGEKVHGLKFLDRVEKVSKEEKLDGVFVQIGLLPNSQFLKGVLELNPFGEVVVDSKGRTSVGGIYAAGDVTTTPYKQIVIAMGEGSKAALTAFEDRMKAV